MNIIKKLSKRLKIRNPYSGFLNLTDYQRVISTDRFEGGKTKLLGHDIEYSDSIGFLHSLEEIFIDEVYNFTPTVDKPVIIDCGSNIGLSIIYFKNKFPNAKIIGFEPDKKIYKLLKANIKSFDFQDVEVYNAAVWIENTELDFFSEGSLAGSTKVDYIKDKNEKYKVEAIDLKEILSSNKVDFLKVDIEGAENILMLDLEDSISSIPFIFIEYHSIFDEPQQLGNILSVLSRNRFRYIIQPAIGGVKYPFYENAKEGFENQLNIYCKRMSS